MWRRLGLLGLVIAGVVAIPLSCRAQEDSGWLRPPLRESARFNCEWWGNCETYYRYRAWRERQARLRIYRQQPRYEPQVRGYIQREDEERYREHRLGSDCRDRRRVVGDQHLSVAGAQGQADKAWSQDVRFYLGERYMDLKNAQAIRYECSRSSVGETLGQIFHRCQITARPCRASETEAEQRQ